jgi:hypothetical protein
MRTTIDLPDDLFRQVKSKAALRGETSKEIVQAAIKKEIFTEAPKNPFRLKFPLIKSKNPKTLSVTSGKIENLLA